MFKLTFLFAFIAILFVPVDVGAVHFDAIGNPNYPDSIFKAYRYFSGDLPITSGTTTVLAFGFIPTEVTSDIVQLYCGDTNMLSLSDFSDQTSFNISALNGHCNNDDVILSISEGSIDFWIQYVNYDTRIVPVDVGTGNIVYGLAIIIFMLSLFMWTFIKSMIYPSK